MAGFLTRPWRRRDLMALGAVALASGLGPAAAAINPAESFVINIADEVMKLANSGQTGPGLKSRFAALLNRHINLRNIANYALGTYRQKLPASRRTEFYSLVNNYAASLFVYYIEDFQGSALDIISTSKQGKYTIIQSAIRSKSGGREQVRWRLVPSGNGFRVHDVNLKGVWMTISMKDRFTKVLNKSKGDFDALFDELRAAETW